MLIDPYRFGLSNPLLMGLVSYWKLDEASGSALDAHGLNPLGITTPTSVKFAAGGKINTARDFEKDNFTYFSAPSNASVVTGDIEFTFVAWVKWESLGSHQIILAKDDNSNVREYTLHYDGSSGLIRGSIFPTGASASAVNVSSTSTGTPTLGQWYFVVFWHDPVANKIFIQVNNATVHEAAVSGGAFVGAAPFTIGAQPAGNALDGLIDEVGFWKRILTPAERTALYNAGNGTPYSSFDANMKQNLVSYWQLDEPYGDAIDAHGTNTLTDVNGGGAGAIGSAAGTINTSRNFDGAGKYFIGLAGDGLSTGDADFTIAVWINRVSVGNNRGICTKWDGTQNEFALVHQDGTAQTSWSVTGPGGTTNLLTTYMSPSLWYHLVAWHDSSNNQIALSINGNAPVVLTHNGGAFFQPTGFFTIGGQFQTGQTSGNTFAGLIDELGFWKRLLTPAERADLFDGMPYPFTPKPVDLLAGLVSYWKMDEASGNAIDAHGANPLTDTGSVGTAAGKVGTARNFNGSSQYFTRPTSGADLSTGDIDFTFACWFRPTALAGTRPLITKWQDSGSLYEFKLFYDGSPGLLTLDVHNGSTSGRAAASNFGVPPLNSWYLVICWHDSVSNRIGICVNNGVPNITMWTTGILARPTMPLWIGARTGSSEFWQGQIDEVGFWKRVLTSAERTALYNSRNGLAYPFDGPQLPSPFLTGLTSYWKMDEASGNALDAHGTNHLTDTNAVGSAPGKVTNARDFESTNSNYFIRTSGAVLSTGDIDFTIALWVKLESISGIQGLISKFSIGGSEEFLLYYFQPTARFRWYVVGSGGPVNVESTNAGAPSAGVWYHLICWHDAVNNQIGITVNNGSPNVLSHSAGVISRTTAPFLIGSYDGTQQYADGLIDEVGFWKRVLTSEERTILYNGGTGLTYPSFT